MSFKKVDDYFEMFSSQPITIESTDKLLDFLLTCTFAENLLVLKKLMYTEICNNNIVMSLIFGTDKYGNKTNYTKTIAYIEYIQSLGEASKNKDEEVAAVWGNKLKDSIEEAINNPEAPEFLKVRF